MLSTLRIRPLLLGLLSCSLPCLVACSKDKAKASAVVKKENVHCTAGPVDSTVGAYDGGHLSAVYHATGKAGDAAVVLQHMTPPHNDRKNFPKVFIQALTSRGINVLNVNRRGAGLSDGRPEDAYVGPLGAQDVDAAMNFVAGQQCAVDVTRIGLVGASNGTTPIWDFSVRMATEKTDPENPRSFSMPKALVFLSGGDYTEKQFSFSDHGATLHKLPLLFVYPAEEAAWNDKIKQAAPPNWRFESISPGAHGTRVFSAAPKSVELIATFLAEKLAK